MEGIVVRRVIPSDNSCLFNAVGYVMDHDQKKAPELRQVIAATVASDPTKYSEAFLGKSNEEYCAWILDSEKWGGAIELSILADYYGREIAAYDIQTTRCDLYGQEKKYSERVMLIYDGLHYDALAMSPFEGAPEEFDQTIFAVHNSSIGPVEGLALNLVKEQQSKRRYTDTANFTLRCGVCQLGLVGRQHIGMLINALKVREKKEDEAISAMNDKMKDVKLLVQSKDKAMGDLEQKLKELEEKLTKAESVAEELRESAKRAAQEHSSELLKHKTAFLEVVSSQRQLGADMGRALRQVEATKRELNVVLDQKEESVLMVQKISAEIVKMHTDLEQKDKILSAMFRKSKLDTTEKHVLLKEIKLSKAKRKQAELETERWKVVSSESRHERHSLRSMLQKANSRFEIVLNERGVNSSATGTSHLQNGKTRPQPINALLGYEHSEFRDDSEGYSFEAKDLVDIKQVEGWVRSEAERYAALIEQRHHLEMDAFVEQLRLKDEKLETYRWRLMSMELESKRLESHVEGLNKDISHLRHDNMKLEALLLEREDELTSLKEQFASQSRFLNCQTNNLNIISTKVKTEDPKKKTSSVEPCEEEGGKKEEETPSSSQFNAATVKSPDKEFESEKDTSHEGTSQAGSASPVEVDGADKLASPSQASSSNTSPWRMDLQALGVSYKIKRLKQQLIMLERFSGKQEAGEDHTESNDDGQSGIKGFLMLMLLLNKQVGRYQSLQGKVDDLCQRMHDNDLDLNGTHGDSNTARTKDKIKTLERHLDETFQLQRYMVATGQKLMEIQPKIASGLVGVAEELETCASFDMKRFTDFIRTLFQEVQRGLEVRIARIIGDLEGTLARDGMIHLRR